jgi:hypothetical protein
MIKMTAALAVALALTAAQSSVASADTASAPAADPAPAAAPMETSPAPTEVPDRPAAAPRKKSRARFSGKRLAVEMVSGAVLGSLVAVGTYRGLGGEGIGPALAAVGANFLVTPLIEWGIGNAMGGHGSLGWTYMGGLIGFSATGVPPEAAIAVAVICLPITSGLMYELSSNKWASQHELGLALQPVVDHGELSGGQATVSFSY